MGQLRLNDKVYTGIAGSFGSFIEIIATLEAGETTLTISNAKITTDSTIDVYTDTFGVSPTDQVVTSGQIVLTFEVQANDLGVKVRVS